MSKDEEDRQGPKLDPGRYYAGTVTNVDFFRNKAGRIVGGRPTGPKNGVSSRPNGQVKLAVKIQLDEFDGEYLVTLPMPWNDREAPPWNGPKDENGQPVFESKDGKQIAVGEPNTFTDDDVTKYAMSLHTGRMKNKIVTVAEAFGWSPFVIGTDGVSVPQELDIAALLTNQRVFVGRVKNESGYTDTEIRPFKKVEKPVTQWISEMIDVLRTATMRSGLPFTMENVASALKVVPDTTGAYAVPDLKRISEVLQSSCSDRDIPCPSAYQGDDAVVKSGGL
jgi:hypothetical protein